MHLQIKEMSSLFSLLEGKLYPRIGRARISLLPPFCGFFTSPATS